MAGPAPIPRTHHLEEPFVPACRDDLLMVGVVQGAETMKDIGGLPHHQPQIRDLEWDVLEAKQRTRVLLMRGDDRRGEIHRRQRHAALDPPLQFEQFDVHIHGLGEARLVLAQRSQRDDLARLAAWGTRGTAGFHGWIILARAC